MINIDPNLGPLMVYKMMTLFASELLFCKYLTKRNNYWVRFIISTIVCLAIAYFVPIDFGQQIVSGSIVFTLHMLISGGWLFSLYQLDINALLYLVSAGKVVVSMAGLIETPLNLIFDYEFKLAPIFTKAGLLFYGRSLLGILLTFIIVYFVFGRRIKRLSLEKKYRPLLWLIFILVFIVDILIYLIFAQYVEGAANIFNIVLYRAVELFMHIFILMLLGFIYMNSEIRTELDSVNALWSRSRNHYELNKETIDAINRKCHDLKHRILEMKMKCPEIDVDDIYRVIDIYDNRVKTGNEVMDVILAEKSLLCADKKIHVECMADGSGLGFIDKVDLFILFGNILDNAIEAAEQLEGENRFILMNVISREGFVFINESNPYIGTLKWRDSLPKTTKQDKSNHGYGMLSIDTVVKRYGGEMIITSDNNLYEIKIIIPIPKK